MTSKFKLPLPAATAEPRPTNTEEFANGAGMVHSQQPQRPLKPVRLNLDLTPDLHERVRRRAADLRLTGAQYVRELILKDLRDRMLE
ncbi:plasmid partition protein ParG [Paraburkholderia sp. MM5477-R1]|uniref:plasmid partition protein ParG n=1 Tax=Paraburkholderia sp. MM5477-R1 TaxID=2991062 RepID=UPI003D25BE40